jgi:hypothetical protein
MEEYDGQVTSLPRHRIYGPLYMGSHMLGTEITSQDVVATNEQRRKVGSLEGGQGHLLQRDIACSRAKAGNVGEVAGLECIGHVRGPAGWPADITYSDGHAVTEGDHGRHASS